MDSSPPDSSVHGISQARILEWVTLDLLDPGIKPTSPALAGGFFTSEPPGKPLLCYTAEEVKAQRGPAFQPGLHSE